MKAQYLLISSALLFATSCSNTNKPEGAATEENTVAKDSLSVAKEEFTMFEFDKMMANFPKPLDMVNEIAKAGVKFDKAAVNDIANEANYTTEAKQAINFGVYSVDLGYLSAYDKKQDIIKSFKTVRKMAEGLNALESFEKVAGSNFETKMSNKDTLMKIADDVYYESYNHIKGSNRLLIATEIVCGSWIESQNFALQGLMNYDRNAKTEFLYNKIFEQKTHLENLLNVMNQFKDNEEMKGMIADFESLKTEYFRFKETKDLNKSTIAELAKAVSTVRTKLIQ